MTTGDPQWFWVNSDDTITTGTTTITGTNTINTSDYFYIDNGASTGPFVINGSTYNYDIDWKKPIPIEEQLRNIKELEKLKKKHKLDDLHIIIEEGDWFYTSYLFVNEVEIQLLKKYSINLKEITSPTEFEQMMCGLDTKSTILKLASSGEEYDNLDDLRKDHLVLKLAGV